MKMLNIRKAFQTDIPTLLELYRVFDHADDPQPDLQAAEAIFARMQTYPNYSVYLAERDGEIVGTFALLIIDNLAHRGMSAGVVENVVVSPQTQDQGIGKEMMEHAMQLCAEAGCYKLVLSSNIISKRAHRFYESLGFEKYGYSFRGELNA